ncbi:MAG: hypothetical protein EP329_26160 [Deltaproteobacteria bacterium]|nr:MAG: hypothetical protein EP329_26160 [Deltaproteobacteria bacterium]
MRHLLPTLLAVAALGGPATAASPTWLPGVTRAVPLEDTASRDAPALEYAWGPRAQLTLGQTLGLVTWAGEGADAVHLWLSGLVALEDAHDEGLFPDELARLVGTLGCTFSFDARRVFGEGGVVELGLELGVERSRELVAAESDRVDLPFTPGDIPFGGGGLWLGADISWRFHVAEAWTLSVRLSDRVFTNGWPLMFGARAASDEVATFLDEGLAQAPSLAVGVRWRAAAGVEPVARVFFEGLFPHDDSASDGLFFRGILGVALPGRYGELLPFLSLDAGNGKGLLVNRHELRLSLGVRHVFR